MSASENAAAVAKMAAFLVTQTDAARCALAATPILRSAQYVFAMRYKAIDAGPKAAVHITVE